MLHQFLTVGILAMALSPVTLASVTHLGSSSDGSGLLAAQICDPAITGPQSYDQMLPCAKARYIEEFLCCPNGTTAADLESHALCMCQSDFFAEKTACDTCTNEYGGIDNLELSLYDGLLHDAHDQLCLGSSIPTAPFASI
ncbi:hypothetical protein ACHAQA_001793 [Verticillium albo-atrum]